MSNCPQDEDPFWEPPDTEVIVGIALVPLNYLSHVVELEDHVTVLNYWAETVGFLNVELRPCDREGDEERVDMLQDPMEMVQYYYAPDTLYSYKANTVS